MEKATTAPTPQSATGAPPGVTLTKLTPEQAHTIENRLYTADDLQGVTMTRVDAPANSVYDSGRDRVLGLPQTMNATETDFVIKRDVDEINTFFAMQDVGGFEALGKGIRGFFGSQPQVAGGLGLEFGESLKADQDYISGLRDKGVIKQYKDLNPKGRALMENIQKALGFNYDELPEEIVSKSGLLIERNKKYMADAGIDGATLEGPNKFLYDLGAGAGSMLTSLGITALTRNPKTASLYFGAMQKSSIYQEARAAGKTPEQATDISNAAGMIEGGLEFVGLDMFMKALRGNSAVKRFVSGFGIEFLQEGAQGVGEETVTQVSGAREKGKLQTAQDILYQAAIGGIIGGPANLAAGAFVRERAAEAGLDEDTTNKLAKYAEDNISVSRENMGEFIDKELAPIARDEKSAQEFITLMQKFGNDVDLVNPDSLDPQTRAVFDQYITLFNESFTDGQGVASVEKTFYDQAITAGVTEDEAVASSKLIGARADAASRALGITPQEWLQSKNIKLNVENGNLVGGLEEFQAEAEALKTNLENPQTLRNLDRNDGRSVAKVLKLPAAPMSVLQYIRSKGGISISSVNDQINRATTKSGRSSGELRRIFDGGQRLGHYVREDGLGMDEIYRALVEGGYIDEQQSAQDQTDTQAVLDLIEREANGQKVYTRDIENQLIDFEDSNASNEQYLGALGIDKNSSVEEIARALAERDTVYIPPLQDEESDIVFQAAGKTNSKEFKAWFGDSKVVDKDGNPLVVYHGTTAKIQAFERDKIGSNFGYDKQGFFFTSDIKDARSYSYTEQERGDKNITMRPEGRAMADARTVSAYLSIKNPLTKSEIASHPDFKKAEYFSAVDFYDNNRALIEKLSEGRDGVIIEKVQGTNLYAAFDPTQIKSVNNRGTFDANDARILNQGPRGSADFSKPGQITINLFKEANASTLLHELGHVFLRDMRDVAKTTKRPLVRKDYETIKKFLGATGDTLTVRQEEKFARAFEQYLREGKAPKPELQGVFDRFKQWLTSIYKSAQDLNVQISPDVHKVFDRMLGADFAIAEKLNQEQAVIDREADYAIAASQAKEGTLRRDTAEVFNDLGDRIGDVFTPISTRLGNINEKLKHIVRRFVFDTNLFTHEDNLKIKPFVERANKEMTPEDYSVLDLALKNRDVDKVDFLMDKYGMTEDYAAVRDVLDNLFNEATAAGMEVGFIDDYFPRKVRRGMAGEYIAEMRMQSQWSDIKLAMDKADPDGLMSLEEQAEFVNSYLRGYQKSTLTMNKPSHTKERSVAYVTPYFNKKYYEDSMETLVGYIGGMRKGIEVRKLFGKSEEEVEDNIGKFVLDLVNKGEILPQQEAELRTLLMAVANPQGPGKFVSWMRDAAYIYTMGSPISAITQIQDLGLSLYKNGFFPTGKSLIKSLTGRAVLTKEDLGIDDIMQEFADQTRSAEAVRKIFRLSGLSFMDNVGKQTYIDASYARLVSANKKGGKEFVDNLEVIFGEDAAQVRKDLKDGTMSDNVKYLLFSELSDMQPISIAEMPVGYARAGNWRVLYMLKTYTIKQFDIYRREGFDLIASGDPKKAAKGLGNLIKLGTCLLLMGMGTDEIKDFLLGRVTTLSDLFMNNIFRLFGVSKYQIYKAKEEGPIMAAALSILPPQFSISTDIYRDITRTATGKEDIKNAKTLGAIPLVGKFYYWWGGGGAAKTKNSQKYTVSTP